MKKLIILLNTFVYRFTIEDMNTLMDRNSKYKVLLQANDIPKSCCIIKLALKNS